MKFFRFISILLVSPVLLFSQDDKFVPLENIKQLEKAYYTKSLVVSNSAATSDYQAHLLRLFNIEGDINSANIAEIRMLPSDTLQISYGDHQTKKFNFKKHKKYIEIRFQYKNVNIPLIYQNTDIDRIRIGLTRDNNMLVQKNVDKSGAILILGAGYAHTNNYIFTDYTNYKDIKPFSENGKWGVKLMQDEIVRPHYDAASIFKIKYILVKSGGKWGLLGPTGESIIPIRYDEIFDLDNVTGNIFYVKNDGKVGLVNSEGKEIVPAQYISIRRFNDDYFEIEQNQKYGLANADKVIFPALYTYLGGLSRGKVWERYLDKENKYITAKRDGKDVILDSLGYEYEPNIKIPTFDIGQNIFPLKETAKKIPVEDQ